MATQPGKGQGMGNPPRGTGGAKQCKCTKCGYTFPHTQKGLPCNSWKCPKCGEDSLIGV